MHRFVPGTKYVYRDAWVEYAGTAVMIGMQYVGRVMLCWELERYKYTSSTGPSTTSYALDRNSYQNQRQRWRFDKRSPHNVIGPIDRAWECCISFLRI